MRVMVEVHGGGWKGEAAEATDSNHIFWKVRFANASKAIWLHKKDEFNNASVSTIKILIIYAFDSVGKFVVFFHFENVLKSERT